MFYPVGVSQHKRDMKNLERVQKGIIITEVKKLKPGMKKETVKMGNMPRYFLFSTHPELKNMKSRGII